MTSGRGTRQGSLEEAASDSRKCSAWALVRKNILGKEGYASSGMWGNLWKFEKRIMVCWVLGSKEEVGGEAGSELGPPTSVLPTPYHPCQRKGDQLVPNKG